MYEAVIGIEVHCELLTNTKMFSASPLRYGVEPNTAINEVDLAYPGTLPQVNAQAVKQAVLLTKALNCTLDPVLRFDRKNYFYSDLPKGYQITQQYYPLGKDGLFPIMVADQVMDVRINRLHLEEDTAKQFHEIDKTLIDFNRAGTPLVEIVTEADFRSGQQAAAYVENLRLLVVHLGVSNGKMAEGSLRCDVNISLRPKGQEKFGTKVEIKNLNSINNIEKAIEYEIKRQTEILDNKEAVVQQTRRFDEASQTTVLMRTKDDVVDYRYFRDPNIPAIKIHDDILNAELIELPLTKMKRYQSEYNLSAYDAKVLVNNPEISQYFDALTSKSSEYKLMVNWLTQDLLAVFDQKEDKSMTEWITPDYFVQFIDAISSKTISSKQAKKVFTGLLEGIEPKKYIKDNKMVQISDEKVLTEWIMDVLENNPQVLDDYRNGLDKSMKFVVGQVMKLSKGQANPQFTNMLVEQILAKLA
ncbi:Asp-tRNA(Asn)/Glu-tRNA(Gln) amidotransferase subunit GatB [Erysipelothrix urinaevulpis]|uniref:Asp-tRNA(Asn)/Glu-tRNA(Gln) amidotransferase subunit GatB n=1 Tax=Erysipelothrix urinaevulpis TaxID=2683717 RepID=UPI00135A718C|nr:Asp-tRNA(Asn)/Glu-tRNA(Gln) amidotransferase subunit GatB [Erysipelothrix urinaevulpis]